MIKLVTDLRSSFWFIPALLVLAAAILALAAIELDTHVGREALLDYPKLFGAGAEGTRQVLSTIAGSTITVAGVVFSITIVALSLTAAQYSPRVLRGFMRDRANQTVLGVFVGTYAYCLIVLRTIQGGEDAFVPGISMLVGLALALIGIGFLIFFVHHIATSIQVAEIAARITRETISAMDEYFSSMAVYSRHRDHEDDLQAWTAVTATETGYIQSVHLTPLLDYARKSGCTVRMGRVVGEFVVAGETLLYVKGEAARGSDAAGLADSYAISTYRDVTQDPLFGVQQLVDIALKALSPGINDTATARTCLEYLVAILFALEDHEIEEERDIVDDAGRVLVIVRTNTAAFLVASAFDGIRRMSVNNVDMLLHILRALERLARLPEKARCRQVLGEQLAAVRDGLDLGQHTTADRATLSAAAARAAHALGRRAG